MTKCPYCGRNLIEDELYCFFCEEDVSKAADKTETPKRKKVKKTVKERTINAYCVKCRKKVNARDPKRYIMKNKRLSVKGTCPYCSTKVFRILGMKKWIDYLIYF